MSVLPECSFENPGLTPLFLIQILMVQLIHIIMLKEDKLVRSLDLQHLQIVGLNMYVMDLQVELSQIKFQSSKF